jgi:co-chaperonin GroES (HSP10)
MKLKPVGTKILVEQLKAENHVTESNIELVETSMAKAQILELSEELAHIYKKGDIVLFPEKSGVLQIYNGKSCLWLNGSGFPQGDVWAIVK